MAESSISNEEFDNSELMKKCQSDPHISSQFEIIEKLGEGGYGTVLKVRLKTDKKIYALKLIPIEKGGKDKLLREAEHLSSLQHKNVVRYFTSWIMGSNSCPEGEVSFEEDKDNENEKKIEDDDEDSVVFEENVSKDKNNSFDFEDIEKDCSGSTDLSASLSKLTLSDDPSGPESDPSADADVMSDEILCIKMEFCKKTLREYIKEKTSRSVDDIEKILSNIVDGLMYIHQKGIIHRDIKPENVFLDEDNCVKIGDFGLSRLYKNNEASSDSEHIESGSLIYTRPVGTFPYMAPEIRTSGSANYGKDVDWYSVGIVLFELCYVFSTGSHRCEVINKLRETSTVVLPDDFESHGIGVDNFKFKILTLLDHNPENRLSAVQTRIQNREIVWYETSGFCSICEIEMQTHNELKEHVTSQQHNDFKADWIKNHKGQGLMQHWCAVCLIPCNQIDSLISHARGKQHDGKIKENKNYYCEICEIYTTGSRNYDQHLASKKHQKAKELKERGYKDKIYTCDTCNINCSGPENLQEHCKSRSHIKKLNTSENEKDYMFFCAQCNIKCNGIESYDQHLVSRRHMRSSGEIQDVQESKGYRCDVCNISCTGPENYKEHIESKNHAKELSSKQVHMCTVCNISCTSDISFQEHLKGQSHMKAVNSQTNANEQKNDYYCDVCEVSCTGPQSYKQHIEGEKHLKKVTKCVDKKQTIIHSETNPADYEVTYYCDVCEISCTGSKSLKQHNEGETHKKKMSKQVDKTEQNFFCEVCKIKCTGSESYKEHCEGKNHRKKLTRLDVLQKLDNSITENHDDTSA